MNKWMKPENVEAGNRLKGLSSFSGAKTYADADMDVLSRHQRFVGDKEFEALHDELVLKHKLDAVIDALEVER